MQGNVILIGFMGSGKTAVGRALSRITGMNLVDTDEYIVKQEGRSVNEIFAGDGEEAFRDMETNAIRELRDSGEPMIISVGGGLPLREENRRILKETGTVVWLQAGVDTLVRRLSRDTSRPLLRGGDLQTRIETMMEQRSPMYADAAHVCVVTDPLSKEEAARAVLREVGAYLNSRSFEA